MKKHLLLLFTALTAGLYAAGAEFPIGVYSPDLTDDAMIAVKNAGFNTVLTYHTADSDYDKLLETAHRNGLKVMFQLDRKLVTQPEGLEKMRQTVRKYRNHPVVNSWYLYDEPSGKITPEVLQPFYEMIKTESPGKPVAIVLCWDETWNRYSKVLDIQMADIYPIRDEKFPDVPLQIFTNFIRETVKLGKPVIPVVQTVSWSSFKEQLQGQGYDLEAFRYPSVAELRYMIFGSMNYGVCGMFGYSYYHATRTGGNPGWWGKECSTAFNELKKFVELVDDPAKPAIFNRALDGNQTAAYWTAKDGSGYLILVNEWPTPRKRPGCWLEGFFKEDYTLTPWGNTRNVKAEIVNNRIKVGEAAEPWEVFIWKLEPKKGK